LLAIPSLQAQTKKLTAAEAKDHIGDRATVCGKVASTHYAKSSKGEPTFLNLDGVSAMFCVLTRHSFGQPEFEGIRNGKSLRRSLPQW
jgi:hypothetical protein